MSDFDIVGAMGDMDIIGADFEVGRRGRRGGGGMMGGGRFAGVRTISTPPTIPRVLFCGFPSFGAIGVGAAVTQTVRPQKPFRVDRLFIPVAAVGILITAFSIGVDPVFANVGGEVDATGFSNNAVSTNLQSPTADKGTDISLTLLNSTAGIVTVRGVTLYGVALER
jgi:hypothetical protein